VSTNRIDEVVLVAARRGCRKVQQLVREFSARSRTKGVNPDEVVPSARRCRAGPHGRREGRAVLDVAPLSLASKRSARDDDAHSEEHDDSNAEERALLDGDRQPDQVEVTCFRAKAARTRQPDARRFHLVGLPSRRAAYRKSKSRSISTPTHRQRVGEDMATAKEQKITISGSGGLSKTRSIGW